jgi:hypothetical protein
VNRFSGEAGQVNWRHRLSRDFGVAGYLEWLSTTSRGLSNLFQSFISGQRPTGIARAGQVNREHRETYRVTPE